MKTINYLFLLSFLYINCIDIANALPLTGLQECQAIKNAAKKADCFEKQTQKMIQEENERKQKEELDKAELEKLKVIKAEKIKTISAAKEVIRSLKKLENRIETGISYRDYPSVFSETRFDVKSFVESVESSKIPQFNLYCLNAVENYTDVQAVWRQKITDTSRYNNDEIYSNWGLIDSIRQKYPATAPASRGRAMNASYVMQVIWSEASENIRKAEAALKAWDNSTD